MPVHALPLVRRSPFPRRRAIARYLFVAPAALFMAAFFIYPMVYNINLSFQHVDIGSYLNGNSPYNGLSNYRWAFGNAEFRQAAANTALFTVFSLLFQFVAGMVLALFFNRRLPLARLIRSLILLPWLLPLVVTASVFQWVFADNTGLVNYLSVNVFHLLPHHVFWLEDTSLALPVAIAANVWIGTPFNMIILHSGLQGIPTEIYEAAAIDGASRVTQFWRITLPLLRPVIAVMLILGFIYTIKVFDIVYVLTGGGPNDSTELLSIFAYKLSFTEYLFGRGAAVGNIMVLVALVCAVGYAFAVRREREWA